ncbi:c-type cytochrome [Sulfurimonas sp. HSL-1716]|uniref:c-type cytochrome n=1 Tax=Hydrocurvibacter sulfurireducens TaxID=3131937 RepID=UPI0031F726DD
MNKLYLAAVVFVAAMLGFTYVAMDIKGGLNGDIVNMLAILGAIALVIVSVFVVTKYVRQMQSDTAGGELADEKWDDIGEYKNPLPMGWAIIFFGMIIWAGWYFVAGYPVNAYSQIGEYNEDSAAANAKFEKKYANLSQEELHNMGESVFLVDCAPCHGLAADGMDGKAANLNKRLEAKTVAYVINHGSNNHLAVHQEMTNGKLVKTTSMMPDRNGLFNSSTNALITDAEIEKVAKYVSNGMKGDGADIFAATCSSCHGPDGKGMDFVAPNIAAFTPAFVADILSHGKKGAIGTMPAFTNLNDTQIKAVSTYITDISKGE